VEWSLARRIGFRFAFALGALMIFPFPIGSIPYTDWIDSALVRPKEWATNWFTAVLGLPAPYDGPNGSGDTAANYAQLLLLVILAAIIALVWSVLDRRRRSYPRLAAGAWVGLRYFVAYIMFSYGVSKVLKQQFYDVAPSVLHQRIGDAPPMRLMWAFMGYSQPYTVFAGLAETVGGALLLWRRTTTLGALIVAAVMTNVVMLNLSYDVPVKLFSSELLVMALVIALPQLRRVVAALLGRATADVPPSVRGSLRRERLRLATKLALLALFTFHLGARFTARPAHDDHVHELYGNWIVDGYVADGVDHPPLVTDAARWETWSVDATSMRIWMMDGTFEGRQEEDRGWYGLKVDPAAHTIDITLGYHKRKSPETWHYSQPAPDRLIIDGVHRGRALHMTMHREPDGVLLSRGFHWFNEVPFNR
jgi:uncharacterized membrane protein YphA (DoxX/SURF4 family)